MEWYAENRARLLRRYPGQYVAIVGRAVIDHDRDFEALADRVFGRLGVRPLFMPRVTSDAAVAHVRARRRDETYTSGLAGRNVSPIRYASTPRAASRPSQIAHTTSDCPRRASPHANTPGTVV